MGKALHWNGPPSRIEVMKGFLGIILMFCGAAFAQPSRAFHSELAGSLPVADSVRSRSTRVTNGASFQTGIAAGSWVTIKGSNLANTDPGRYLAR